MGDSVQMMDLVSLSKNLTRMRGTDPEQRAAAERLAGTAAARELEELHQDVEESEETREARLRARKERDSGGQDHPRQGRQQKDAPPDAVPEQDEGHLLNLKA